MPSSPQSLLAASGKVEAEGTTSLERHLSAPGNTTMTGVAKGSLYVQLPMTNS